MEAFLPVGIASLGVSAVAALIALALLRLRVSPTWAVILAGLAPGIAIISYYFYLESQQPLGPYHAVIGLLYGVPALVFGLAAAMVAVLVRRQMGTSAHERRD